MLQRMQRPAGVGVALFAFVEEANHTYGAESEDRNADVRQTLQYLVCVTLISTVVHP